MLDQKINTVVIERNPEELYKLNSLLKKENDLSIIGTATSGQKGISLITNYAPQLVFINVILQDINGLEFIRILQNRNIFSEIVFVAQDSYFSYDSLSLEPLDFMVKPIEKETIQQMLIRLKIKLKRNELVRKMEIYTKSQSIDEKRTLQQKNGIIVLLLEEIVFMRAERTNTVLVLISGEEIMLKTGITQTMETINNQDFVRVNRSFCINKNYLRKVDRRNVKCLMYFEGKSWEVPASKNTLGQLEKLNVSPIY